MRARILDPETRKWWTLGAVAFGLFMIMLDNTVVNVALPAIAADLQIGLSELEWIVTGYALTFACGLGGGGELLIGARVVRGAGAALMTPATLSIIAAAFPPRQRGMAIGIWAGVSALALAIGPLVGGLLTDHLDWSWIFFVNVPVGIVAIVASFVLIDESRDT